MTAAQSEPQPLDYRDLTRSEMIRVLNEFMSERDAAKVDTMRARDELNIQYARLTRAESERDAAMEALRELVDAHDDTAANGAITYALIAANAILAKARP